MIKNITAKECLKALKENNNAKLIDVRTPIEWENDGYADLTSINKEVNLISWTNTDGTYNEKFFINIKNLNIEKDDMLFIVCRSGVRSAHAVNYLNDNFVSKNIFNLEGGMEFGWKISHLPIK
ncbi:rhodanese-like domain-containing protein [Pelagibacterales bacterium]|jgi:rhodanese-related sulfurtransferase|nr:rhodanese-like domain-containing protein [Pelagibacterales bacterium]MDB9817980.1 rhodanese-like domain-containing protein [Pelagibacterales bacterium]|tara:strand:+ start:386 stop:754 length:369 start_codon:yes stop_codon:yes gene_type:complete